MVTATSTPVRQSAAELCSFVIAGLAAIALLLGGLALHTGSGAHAGHEPAVSAQHHTTATAGMTAEGTAAAGMTAAGTAEGTAAAGMTAAGTAEGTAAAGMTAAASAGPAALVGGSIAALGAVGAGIAAVGVTSAAVDHGLGSDLLATCALLLALAGSVALIFLGRARQGRDCSVAPADSLRGSIRQYARRRPDLGVHRPDLTVLSISRR